MLKKILGFIPVMLFLFCSIAWGADEPLRMSKLEVQVMPEFVRPADWPEDQPCLLTGVYGTLVNKGSKPYSGSVELKVPKVKGTSVHLVGEFKNGQGPVAQVKYEWLADQGSIIWKPIQPIESGKPYFFVVEYYSNPFTMKEKEHKFDFQFQANYDIDDLQFYFYKPIQSEGFQLSEPHQQEFVNEFGQEIYQIQVGSFKSRNERRLTVQYRKDDLETVLEKHSKMAQQNQSAPAATESVDENETSGKQADASKDSWIIGGSIVIFGLLVFAGLRSYWVPLRHGAEAANPGGQKQEQIRALRRRLMAEELSEDEYLIERKKIV